MLRIIAILFGIIFIFIGVAGYLPVFLEGDLLFGYFSVNALHNMIHLAVGVLAILSATSHRAVRLYFKLLGLLFFVAGIWGFWNAGDMMLMHLNTSDNVLHVVVGVFALYLGFKKEKQSI